MAGFRKPEQPRDQMVLYNPVLDDIVDSKHPVRNINMIIDSKPFKELIDELVSTYDLTKGKPPYHPSFMLKLFLYGYLNKLFSSRQLQQACHNRTDFIWLMSGQKPDFTTIALFMRKHASALEKALKKSIEIGIRAELIGFCTLGVDGSVFAANASKGSVRSEENLQKRLEKVNQEIEAFQQAWANNETKDQELFGDAAPFVPPSKEQQAKYDEKSRLEEALAQINRREEEAVKQEVKRNNSTTDPDSRPMKDKQGVSRPAFNTQVCTDKEAGFITATDVDDAASDAGKLVPMLEKSEENCGQQHENVLVDGAYGDAGSVAQANAKGVTVFAPEAGVTKKKREELESLNHARQKIEKGERLRIEELESLPRNHEDKLHKDLFLHDESNDTVLCPGGAILSLKSKQIKKRMTGSVEVRQYQNAEACQTCPLRSICCKTEKPNSSRTISMDGYEKVRLKQRAFMATPEAQAKYKERAPLAETPFGRIKQQFGFRQFLRRGLKMVRSEWGLICTAYNIGKLMKNWDKVAPTL